MERSALTLAALANSAVDDLDISSAATFTSGTVGDFDSATLATTDGRQLIIRVPTSRKASEHLALVHKSLNALSAGIRSRLPFAIPDIVGRLEGELPGFVYTFVPGNKGQIARLNSSRTAESIGSAIAAIHNLPHQFVDDYTLPHLTVTDTIAELASNIDRAMASKKVPKSLAARWESALSYDELWRFEPTVVNADLDDHSLVFEHNRVSGILEWESLRIGDPAADLAWFVYAAPHGFADEILVSYEDARDASPDLFLKERAMLHSEVGLAKWLVFGLESKQPAIVEDASRMLSGLADDVDAGLMPDLTRPTVAEQPQPFAPEFEAVGTPEVEVAPEVDDTPEVEGTPEVDDTPAATAPAGRSTGDASAVATDNPGGSATTASTVHQTEVLDFDGIDFERVGDPAGTDAGEQAPASDVHPPQAS